MFSFLCGVCNETSATKLLPCLHTICNTCLSKCTDTHFDTGIFKCKQCDTSTQIPKSGAEGLKDLGYNTDDISKYGRFITCHTAQTSDFKDAMRDLFNDTEVESNHKTDNFAHNNIKVKLENSHSDANSDTSFDKYCITCDVLVCDLCLERSHEKHNVLQCESFVKLKTEFIKQMIVSAKNQLDDQCKLSTSAEQKSSSLENSLKRIKIDIEERADKLCALIMKKRDNLMQNIDEIIEYQKDFYKQKQEKVEKTMRAIEDAVAFSETVLNSECGYDLFNLHNEISCRLSQLVQQAKDTLKLLNVKLDAPDRGRTEVYVDKLYGALVQGDVVCGDADLLTTFKCDLSWPCGLAVTKSSDYLVCGKLGAFEQSGKLLSYDKHGHCNFTHEFPQNILPSGLCISSHSNIYISTSDGDVLCLSSNGMLLNRWTKCFQGVGCLAEYNEHIYVTSSDEKCIKRFELNGNEIDVIKPMISSSQKGDMFPNSVSVSCDGLIAITSLHSSSVFVIDSSGNIQFEFSDKEIIQCPSAIRFDKFGNLLVADFTSDCVHILSNDGWYFGKLLTKSHGVSCPNAIAFDNDGHLLVGQYGGEVQILRYMSLEKQL